MRMKPPVLVIPSSSMRHVYRAIQERHRNPPGLLWELLRALHTIWCVLFVGQTLD